MSKFLEIAESLFKKCRVSMSARRLVEMAKEEGMLPDTFSGKTPHQTMKSKLSVDIRKLGEKSIFVRTGPGLFYLRELLDDGNALYQAKALRPPPSKEDVVVFPSAWLDEFGRFQGIINEPNTLLQSLVDANIVKVMPRLPAEQDDLHKQVLTYVMVVRHGRILAYKRGTYNRVEDFLRGSHCVGFGGHVIWSDTNLFDGYQPNVFECARRELVEELRLPPQDRDRLHSYQGLNLVGVLNDDSSSVGRRHIAFIFRYDASDSPLWESPERQEQSITNLRWLDLTKDGVDLQQFEYWSQLCLLHYFAEDIAALPSYIVRPRYKRSARSLSPMLVLGPVGSGKTEATRVLREEFGYFEVNSGQVIAKLLGMPPPNADTRAKFGEFAFKFISEPNGPLRLANSIYEEVVNSNAGKILIDGVRQRATLDALKQRFGTQMRIIYVHTPPHVAYEFFRKRTGGNTTLEDFFKMRESPVELESYSFIRDADAVLYNWTGRDEYVASVRSLMKELLER